MSTYKGTIKGNVIVLDESLGLPEGTRVDVALRREISLRKGSPRAVLKLAGSLSSQEAEQLRQIIYGARRVEPESPG